MRRILYGAGSAAVAVLLVAGLLLALRREGPEVAPGHPPAGEVPPPSRTPAEVSDAPEEPQISAAVPDDELVAMLQGEIARLEGELEALHLELQAERDRAAELETKGLEMEIQAQRFEEEPRDPPPARLEAVAPATSAEDSGESRLAYLQGIDTASWSEDDARVHADVLDALSRARQIEAGIAEEGSSAERVALRRELGEVRRQLAPLLERERKALITHELRSLGLEGDRTGEVSGRLEDIIRSTESSPARSERRRAWTDLGRDPAER